MGGSYETHKTEAKTRIFVDEILAYFCEQFNSHEDNFAAIQDPALFQLMKDEYKETELPLYFIPELEIKIFESCIRPDYVIMRRSTSQISDVNRPLYVIEVKKPVG